MQLRRVRIVFIILIAAIGASIATLFFRGSEVLALLGAVIIAGLVWTGSRAAKLQRSGDPTSWSSSSPRPAIAPPDGHIRFTLVIEGLEEERVAEVWSDLCRPDRPATEEFRLLFRNFTVTEGRRFRFRRGDPSATAALLTSVFGAAAGVSIRTSLEPAAERTPPWS
jgi:hypothetical protein